MHENTGQIASPIDSVRGSSFYFSIRNDPVLYGTAGNPNFKDR